jgi:hypothetical protein
MTFRFWLHSLLLVFHATQGSAPQGCLQERSELSCANPEIVQSASSVGTSPITGTDRPLSCTDDQGCEVTVAVGNSGNISGFFSVSLSYNQFGITFGGWEHVASQTARLAPSQQLVAVTFHLDPGLWQEYSRICLKITLEPIWGGNCNTTVSSPPHVAAPLRNGDSVHVSHDICP